jgi:ketosteroid isomerase-like protein
MEHPEKGVRDAERDFEHALVAAETALLEKVLADDFVLADLSGALVTKEELLGKLSSGELKFEAIHPNDISVRMYENAAVVIGWTEMSASYKGAKFTGKSRFTHIYVKQLGRWRMVAAQGTPSQD